MLKLFQVAILLSLSWSTPTHAFDLKKLQEGLGGALKELEQNLEKGLQQELQKSDQNQVDNQPKKVEKPAKVETKKKSETASNNNQVLDAKTQTTLQAELNFLIENQNVFSNEMSGRENMDYLPYEYSNFETKEISYKSTGKDVWRKGVDGTMKNCGKVITKITFQTKNTATLTSNPEKNKPATCDVKKQFPLVWASKQNKVVYSYTGTFNNVPSIWSQTLEIDFEREKIESKNYVNSSGSREDFQSTHYDLIALTDTKSGKNLPIGPEHFYQIKEKHREKIYVASLQENTEKKTSLFGIRVLDNPSNYKISNKRRGEEVRPIAGNTLTEILEANYGAKLVFNFYDVEPPIKNKSFYDYKIRTVSVNGIEIISSINARADCPLKGLGGCREFGSAIDDALYNKYGFVMDKAFEVLDENENTLTAKLNQMYTVDGEFTTGAGYLNADGIWMSLGVQWSEESLLAKFGIDPSSKKSVDTNF